MQRRSFLGLMAASVLAPQDMLKPKTHIPKPRIPPRRVAFYGWQEHGFAIIDRRAKELILKQLGV
ncbi:MAG: hypothetical protein ACXABY_04235 [Candidatus Thorarchaeota archaeon]